MIKAIIIDDDKRSRLTLHHLILSSFNYIEIVAECSSADEGMKTIVGLNPDLIFLDVEMPGKTGFDLINELHDIAYNFNIIFTTAHEHYALQAIKASAFDFLLKPIGEDDLRDALSRLDRKRSKEQVMQQMEIFSRRYANDSNQNNKIALPTMTGYIFIRIRDIVRCEADRNYSIFFFADKSKMIIPKSLKEYEEILSIYGFVRVHHSHLINMHCIKEYTKGEGGIVIMNDNTKIEVSRRKKDEFLSKLPIRG